MLTLDECLRHKTTGILLLEPDVTAAERVLTTLGPVGRPVLQWTSTHTWGEEPSALGQRLSLTAPPMKEPTIDKVLGDIEKVRAGLKQQLAKEDTAMARGVLVSMYDLGDLVRAPALSRILSDMIPILHRLEGYLVVVVPTLEQAGLLREFLVPVALTARERYGDLADGLAEAVTKAGVELNRWAVIMALDGLRPAIATATVRAVYHGIATHQIAADTEAILVALKRVGQSMAIESGA